MRIAIIGAGISGLACAHALHRDHEVTVFEAADRAGGHANTVAVELAEGGVNVDTGFIVFNDRNYPSFGRLLDELGVPSQSSQMSFGVSDGADFEYNGASPNGLFACRGHLRDRTFHRMVSDLIRFNRDAKALLASDDDPTLAQWLEQRGYSQLFVDRLIVPQVSAVWSTDPGQMWSFPARFLAEFFDNHGMFELRHRPRWRTIAGGSQVYVEAITRPWRDRLRLATPVDEVARAESHVSVVARGGAAEEFDAVVFACHSDQALSILADPSDGERDLLGAIPYRGNEAVLHTDRSLLPRRRRAWASWNYHLDSEVADRPTVTYHMNRLQSLPCTEQLCVTLNRTHAIDPDKVIATFDYAHPVYTRQGVAAQARVHEISGVNRTHYCGAYWGWGFHEDGAASGLRAARELGARTLVSV